MHAVGLTMYSSGAFSHRKEAYATVQSVPLAILGPLADFSQNLREQLISGGSHPCTEHPPRALQAALRFCSQTLQNLHRRDIASHLHKFWWEFVSCWTPENPTINPWENKFLSCAALLLFNFLR